jgi:hypothetical protein
MQKAMVYFSFIIKRDYIHANKLVKKLEMAPMEIFTLFEELFPKNLMKQLRETFTSIDFQPYMLD